jgi:hypothetical protein
MSTNREVPCSAPSRAPPSSCSWGCPFGARAALTIEDGDGKHVWRGEGLVAGPPGGFTVVVPVELLPDGPYAMTVQPARGRPVVYRLRVRRS